MKKLVTAALIASSLVGTAASAGNIHDWRFDITSNNWWSGMIYKASKGELIKYGRVVTSLAHMAEDIEACHSTQMANWKVGEAILEWKGGSRGVTDMHAITEAKVKQFCG